MGGNEVKIGENGVNRDTLARAKQKLSYGMSWMCNFLFLFVLGNLFIFRHYYLVHFCFLCLLASPRFCFSGGQFAFPMFFFQINCVSMKTDICYLTFSLTKFAFFFFKLVVHYQVQPFRPRLRWLGLLRVAPSCTALAARTRCRPTGGGTGPASDASGPCSDR